MKTIRHQYHQYLAEFIGTFFLIFFGCGSIILTQVYESTLMGATGIPLAFGGVVAVMIYSLGHISGAHFNPAVTIAFFVIKKFPFKRVPGYLFAQFLGGVAASSAHKIIFSFSEHNFGATFLKIGMVEGALMEFIMSFLLMFVITSVATDSRAIGEMAGTAIGGAVFLCALVAGPLTGASMNPARSLGPALISGNLEGIWVYLIIPVLAAALGALSYRAIRCFREEESDNPGCC